MGKATNVKFGRYIQWENGAWAYGIQGLPKFFEYPLLSQERVKLRTSTFVRTFLVSIGTKVCYKFLEK